MSFESIHIELIANLILTKLNVFDKLEHRRSQDFWLGGGEPKYAMSTPSEIFEKNFFWVKDTVELWSELGALAARNRDFAKRENLNPKLILFIKNV